jgi:folate-binding protein YgfZ
MDVTADYVALRREAGATKVARDVVRVSGPDTIGYLQGQLSQDVAALSVGDSTWSLLLQPQGKLDAWVRVSRVGADEVMVDVDAGWGEAVIARLTRFKLRTKCEVEPVEGWRCIAVRGPGTPALAVEQAGALVVADAGWPHLPGVDLLGPTVEWPPGVRRCDREAYDSVRIECGVPAMGSELDTGTIPAEAGIVERSVSFTKGCYTGQELVARIDSRGSNVPRHLRGVVIGTNVVPPAGATLHVDDGTEVGRLTSVGESLDLRAPVALAYVRRVVSPPADVTVRWEGMQVPAQVRILPLI